MSRWKQADQADVFGLAALVPDALPVHDGQQKLIAWDEAAVHAYELAHGVPTLCNNQCVGRQHVLLA